MTQVNVHEAKTHLSRLIRAALDGEDVVIAKDNRPPDHQAEGKRSTSGFGDPVGGNRAASIPGKQGAGRDPPLGRFRRGDRRRRSRAASPIRWQIGSRMEQVVVISCHADHHRRGRPRHSEIKP